MDTQSLANTALHRYYAKRPLHSLFHRDMGLEGVYREPYNWLATQHPAYTMIFNE